MNDQTNRGRGGGTDGVSRRLPGSGRKGAASSAASSRSSSNASRTGSNRPGRTGAAPAGASGAKTRRGRRKKPRSLAFKIIVGTLTALASLFLLAVLAFVVLYLSIGIPNPNPQAQQAVSIVYYSDGKTEMGRFAATNREPIQLKQVPVSVQRAFLAAEDRTFYQNRGISPTGIARAFYNDFTGKGNGSQGGSTLTQQYVKNYFLSQDKTISRKVKEIIISLKIDQEHSKSQILQDYLNSVYFGRGTYGIQAASKSYFHKDVSRLTPVEGAFLASVVNNPDNMDPTVGPNSEKRANERMAYVLNGMVTMKWMTQAERDKAVMPTFYKRQPLKSAGGPQGYIVQSVRAELARKLKLTPQDIDRGGLRITTTIDKTREDAAIKAVEDNTPVNLKGKLRTGLVAQKPNDGAIVAMYGGSNYNAVTSPYSDADQAVLQAASTMKLYTAVAALEHGKSLNSVYNGNTMYPIGKNQYVSNDNNESYGQVNLTNMLAFSVNTAFVRLNREIGPQKTLDAAIASGIPKTMGGMDDTNILNTLGTSSARVVDEATGYNTLNSGGQHYDGYLISKVSTADGHYSYKVNTTPKRAYDKGIADDLTYALNKVTTYGTAANLSASLGRPAAGKTGTASGNRYIWFTGFTPGQLTTSVGMYYTKDGKSSQSMQGLPGLTAQDIYGAGLPTQIWRDFMTAALKGEPIAKLPARSYWNSAKPASSPAATGGSAAPQPTPTYTYRTPTAAPVQPYQAPTRQVAPTSQDAPATSQQDQGTGQTIPVQPSPGASTSREGQTGQAPRQTSSAVSSSP